MVISAYEAFAFDLDRVELHDTLKVIATTYVFRLCFGCVIYWYVADRPVLRRLAHFPSGVFRLQ